MTMMSVKPSFYLLVIVATLLSACNTLTVSDGDSNAVDREIPPGEAIADVATIPDDDGDEDEDKPEIGDTGLSETGVSTAGEKVPTQPDAQLNLERDELFNLLAAEFAGNVGDVETSLNYYREAAKSIDDSRIAARAAYIALYGERYDEALEALDRWSVLEPDAMDLPRMYATTYLKLGQPEKAVPYIEDILASAGADPVEEALAVKQLLAKEATVNDGYVVLQKMNETEPRNTHLLVLQSRYAAQLEHYDESLALLDEVLEIDPSQYEVLIIKSRILTAQGKHEEAALIIKDLLQKLPDNNTLRLQYARMMVEHNNLPAAVEQYSILHENIPDDGDIALSLALLKIETKDLDGAVEVLEHLIEIDEKTPAANYYLGRIMQNQGDDKLAVSYYLRVQSGEYVYDAQLRVGMLLAVLGKPDEGLAKLEALAESQNDWSLKVKSYLAQGEIYRSEQRYKEGVDMYTRALMQNRDDINLLYARGLMAEKIDRLDMAEADLLMVIKKQPDNASALNALGYTLADRTTRYQEALDYIKRAAELVPDDPAILDSLGWVSYRLGNTEDALKWLSRAFDMMEDAEIAAHYGEVLWQNNQKEKARAVWEKGKANNASNPVLIETLQRISP